MAFQKGGVRLEDNEEVPLTGPQDRSIVERVRIECTDCGGLIDADMAIRHDDKPYCGECQDRHRPIVERTCYLLEHPDVDADESGERTCGGERCPQWDGGDCGYLKAPERPKVKPEHTEQARQEVAHILGLPSPPPERPIVNRPESPECKMFHEFPGQWAMDAWAHIERLEKEGERLEAAIRQKDNALEVCGDRRWEAEEKVGELMEEVDRLNAAIKNVRR